ncbi:kinase-like domain-containing protein [Boeremia exigua]|uniref:kinase-like domain-containing protein n=1 Tax=Boeremia exigua TaxID=749465 RepID=UPI001E8C9E91|nr:kinase-like domain-containing protein [Boeremia exigua]KAH6625333.1 kinase-like domain-containing protein [Boeremia exigua]
MAKKKGALYKAARYYYMGAYRLRMKELRDTWSTAERDATLHWMWTHVATQAERDECEQLFRSKSGENTFNADDARIPAEHRAAGDPAPAAIPGPAAVPGPAVLVTTVSVAAVTAPTAPPAPPKTRVFSHMPPLKNISMELPAFDPDEGPLSTDGKRKLIDAGLADPDKEPEAKRWHGTHFLGQGATGICMHWVRTDENNNIDQRLAVRDIATMHQDQWINPIKWRDQLPTEIAVLRRLNEQQGYNHNLHRYYGHRIDGWKRRYRVYNEVCDLGNLSGALEYYSRAWRRRHTQHRWLMAHPEIGNARDLGRRGSAVQVKRDVRDARARVWAEYLDAKEENPESHKDVHFDDLTDLEDCAKEEISDDLPEVIPEAFLWQVFGQLAGAALLMHRGADPLVGEKEWKEIVHRDIHLGNIFVKPSKEGAYGSERKPDPRKPEDGIAKFAKTEYPDIVLADFDTAFWDLQNDDDEYQDNPLHYMCSDSTPELAARYPPETSWAFQTHSHTLTKQTSATDIWSIGQIMWNLLLNLPTYTAFTAPFFDHASEHTGLRQARRLNDGQPYTRTQLNRFLLTGHRPFEAPMAYSKLLRSTVRACLQYMPADRVGVRELKKITEMARAKALAEEGEGALWVGVDGGMERYRVGAAFVGAT